MTLTPLCSAISLIVQEPDAVPLPLRSLLHETCVTPTLSLALPPRLTVLLLVGDYDAVMAHMAGKGLVEGEQENLHDDAFTTLNMYVVDPGSVRFAARREAGKARINGVDIADAARNAQLGREIVEFRAAYTAKAIAALRAGASGSR